MTRVHMKFGELVIPIPMSGLKLSHHEQGPGLPVSIRCPHCSMMGIFPALQHGGNNHAHKVTWNKRDHVRSLWVGVRYCPNEDCRAPVFVVASDASALLTFPPSTIEFNSENLPPQVRESLSEAIQCHANGCYRAAALLVRRTLEEVCADKGAKGKDLDKRIAALREEITLPVALFEAMTSLRLLGNDAAHIEAKTYDKVGPDEVEAALTLTKEIVKACYQYGDLLEKLRGFARTSDEES